MRRVYVLCGSALFAVVTSFICHLIAISGKNWIINTCLICDSNDPLKTWTTSLRDRCYPVPLVLESASNNSDHMSHVELLNKTNCFPKQYFTVKDLNQVDYCFKKSIKQPDLICPTGDYNHDYCKCDYTATTQAETAMAILAAILLGIVIILTCFLGFVRKDHLLRWLIPLGIFLLAFSIISVIAVVGMVYANLYEDIRELRVGWSLFQGTFTNQTVIAENDEVYKTQILVTFDARVGWCFVLEIVAIGLAAFGLAAYSLMLLDRHPYKYTRQLA